MIALGLASFFAFGGLLVLVGANQAALAHALELDLAGTGGLAAAVALGLGIGIAGSGPAVDRLPRRPLYALAAALAALSLLTVHPAMGFAGAFLRLAGAGIGAGVFETLLNAVLAERYREAAARPLTLVHAAATAGAVVAPPLMGLAGAALDWTAAFRGLGILFLALAVWGLLGPLPRPPGRPSSASAGERRVPLPALAPLAGMAALYVGFETALTAFAVPYATTGLGRGEATGRTAISALWLGLLLGRLAFAALARREGARALPAMAFAAAALLGLGVALRAPQLPLVFGLAGLCVGPVFPVLVAMAARRAPDAAGTATGLVAGAGALGGFATPGLAGLLGDGLGPTAALSSLVAVCTALGALALWPTTSRGPAPG